MSSAKTPEGAICMRTETKIKYVTPFHTLFWLQLNEYHTGSYIIINEFNACGNRFGLL